MRSRRRSRKKAIPWRQLAIWILVGAIAILCGWMINTLLLQGYLWAPAETNMDPVIGQQPDPVPNNSSLTEKKEPSDATAQIKLRSVQYFLTQVGAIGTEAGANALIEGLKEQGNPAAYHFDGELYRVFAGIFTDKAAADALGQMFKSSQVDAFTKEVAWPAVSGTLEGAAGAYFSVVQPAIVVMEDAFAHILSTNGLDQAQLAKMQSSVQAAQATLSEASPGNDLVTLHNDLQAACSKLKNTIDALKQFIETGDDRSRFAGESQLIEFTSYYQAFTSSIRALLK